MEGNCSEIKKLFAVNDKTIVIDGEKKKQALEQIRTNMQGNATSVQKSKWQIFKIQICYMDKAILLMHLTVCIGFVLLGKWQFWERSSTIFACVLGALSLIEVSHMFFSGMTEVEESCYFNVRQVVVFRMACSGIISLAALLAALVTAGGEEGVPVMEMGLYMLVPFVFTECVCMTVMITESGRRNKVVLIAAGIFSVLFWSVLSCVPHLYEASATAFWGMAFFAGMGISAIQTKRFFRALEKGEILCVD